MLTILVLLLLVVSIFGGFLLEKVARREANSILLAVIFAMALGMCSWIPFLLFSSTHGFIQEDTKSLFLIVAVMLSILSACLAFHITALPKKSFVFSPMNDPGGDGPPG